MPAKKNTTKKTTKKTTTKKTTKSVPKKIEIVKNKISPWALCALLVGALVGSWLHQFSWVEKIGDEEMFVANGKTWIPVAGEPLELYILNDKTCGNACDATQSISVLRQNITPALITKTIDVASEKGQKLVDEFSIKSVPQYFFADDIADTQADDGTKFVDNLPAGFLTLKDDLYHLNNTQVGFRVGKFTQTPEFSDLDTEPKRGSGPVMVVEFTDYQCPFCKRLHDQNKVLIDQLVAANKITYVVKDFPLNFHADAVDYAHGVANCALKEAGQDAYWSMKDIIFGNFESWSGKGDEGKAYLVGQASALGADVTACLADPATRAEQDADQAEGYLYGVSGTPAVFIGSQVMPGAIGPDVFAAAVEAELAK